jgi:predicted RND superfamily exporter protein
MDKTASLIIRFKWFIVALVTALTLFFSWELTHIKVDSNILNALPQDDPDVKLFRDVGASFGSNQIGMIIIKGENVLMPGILNDVARVTDTLANIEGIVGVTSVTNMMTMQVTPDDFQVDNLINDQNRPENRAQADSLLKKIVQNDMITGSLIAQNGTSTVVLFSFDEAYDVDSLSPVVMQKINQLHLSEEYYFAGAPFMRAYVSLVVRHDMTILIPIAFVLISLLLYLSFRSWRGVYLPLLTAGLSIVWSMGTFSLLGMKLSMVTNNVPIILLAVGTAYAIHIINRVNHCREKDKRTAVRTSLRLMMVPVSLTALTTMVGFLSFIFGAYLTMIRDFGVLSALGTFFAALLALFFVPALLAILPAEQKPETQPDETRDDSSWLTNKFLIPLSERVISRPGLILKVWLLIFVLSIGGIYMIKRSVSVAGYFKKSHPVSISEDILANDYGGTKPVFIVFKGDVQSPEVLKAMMDLEAYMKKSPLIGSTQSVANVIAKLNQALTGNDEIPESEMVIGQIWFLIGQQESISRLVTPDMDQALIIAKFQDRGDNSTLELEQYMNAYFKEHQSSDYEIEMTGMPFINVKLSDNLLYSQIMSLLIALVLVMIIVSLMLKSVRRGLYASLPIIVTIGIMYGVMGFTGIPLNIVTMLVASIAMGIGIDYSIHFFSYFNYSRKNGKSSEDAIRESIRVAGKAIIINFVSVSLGFMVLIFSNFVAMIYFGIIIALSMLGASMGALTLLPSILLLENKKKQKQ